ncbi:MAG: hypothetical protein OEO23_10005, partial [Gemmatimonadota bacterium]|nr:hypothetical protein [Gemmatimonadota bacterium]
MLQLVDVLAEPMGLSMTLRQGLLVVLAVGFLLTLVLAWYHGEKGHQRVSGPELLIIAGLAAIAGLGLMLLGGGEGESEVDEPEAAAPAAAGGRPAIAVLPFDDL